MPSLGLPTILADRVALQQVLMNLMLNAVEAMKEMSPPGKLTITTRQDENRRIIVSVTDTGVGLPPESAEEIFTAFFTSKSSLHLTHHLSAMKLDRDQGSPKLRRNLLIRQSRHD